jgi:lipopolysaccharide export system permease protein
MSLISRYILGQFLAAVAVSLLAFVGIFYVVDLISQLDKFLDRQVGARYVFLYYLFFLPYVVVLTVPVSMLLGSLFTFGQLAKYGELTAMKASGLSLYRLLRPMLIASVVVSGGIFAAGEWIVPASNQRRSDIQTDHVERQSRESSSLRNLVLFRGEDGRQYFLRLYNGLQKRASEVLVMEFREGAIVKTVSAREMVWREDRWWLRNGRVWEFLPKGALLSAVSFDSLECPAWAERPEDFLQGQKRPEAMNYGELQRYIRNVQRGGGDVQGYLVDLNLKVAFPCASIIIVLFGGALAAHVRRSGAAVGFAMSIGICFLYWGLLRISQAFGHAGTLTPLAAAWGPNLLFGLLGILLLLRAPK